MPKDEDRCCNLASDAPDDRIYSDYFLTDKR